LSNETKDLMNRAFLLLIILAIYFAGSSSQVKQDNKSKFYQAEGFILYEEYKDALTLYRQLLAGDPNNANIKYRIGQCLINIPGRKKEAIGYLEDAVKNINLKYREGRYKETNAPYDAYYFLANAYRINNQLLKAIETYELFKKNLDPKVYKTEVVNLQIESCKTAIELMKAPLYLKKVNQGELVNGRFSDYNPVVSADESVMVYAKGGQFQDFVYFTKKVNGKWTIPTDIIPNFGLGFEEKNYPTSLSDDGRELFLYRPGPDYDGNIYVSKRDKNDNWSNLGKLNDNINTKYWESHATMSHDGKILYFTSNRKGTYGMLDIWVSRRDSTGDWGPAKNLGPVINTEYNEESPFLGQDDKTLFFSSAGHLNMGGYDNFYSTMMENGQWSEPLNLGYPLNTTDDDLFFNPVGDGYSAYYTMIDSGDFGLQDIYRIEVFSKDHPRKFFVKGIVQVKDLQSIFKDSVKISAFNLEDPNATVIVYSNPLTGEYKFELPHGKYSVTYEADGAEKVVKNIELPLTNPADSFILPGRTLPKVDFVADMAVESNKTLSVAKGDTLSFPLKVESKSVLVIEHWLGDSLLYTETHTILDSTGYVYKTVPLQGDNRIVFKLTDKFNNTATSDIFIKREKVVARVPVEKPEYTRIISRKQLNSFVELAKSRGDDNMDKVIQRAAITRQKFGSVDDIIAYLKEEAKKSSISPTTVDKMALKIAAMDNVLTQAAVDLIATSSCGEIKAILSNLNIYVAGLTSWTDLQKYLLEKHKGMIPEELNRITADILSDTDPSIFKLKEKILAYSSKFDKGEIIKKSISTTDQKNIKSSGEWLRSVYNLSIAENIRDYEMAAMLAVISSLPGTDGVKYKEELSGYADEKLKDYLNTSDFNKSVNKTPKDLLLNLLRSRNKGYFPEMSLFNAPVCLIITKDIPLETIASQAAIKTKNNLWIIWLVVGSGLVFFYFVYSSRKKKKEK
jgi:tetratricopeptide (TPR) repeat protein